MTLSESAAVVVAAVIGAFGSGGVSLFIYWRQTKSPRYQRRVKDAWQKQAEQLDERLRHQYERQITYLEAQIEKRDREEQSRRDRGSPHE